MAQKLLLLAAMLFFHVVDDFYSQGILASMKQKKWWTDQTTDPLYRHDYILALLTHAFSWAFMIHIPAVAWQWLTHDKQFLSGGLLAAAVAVFVLQWAVHATVDHLKANLHKINLWHDQLIHVVQIIVLWALYVFLF